MSRNDDDTNPLVELERARFELLKDVEEARLEVEHRYTEKRLKLLSENQDEIEWLLEALSDLRKERKKFQQKSVPEIAEALSDGEVPEELVENWLTEITDLYHSDLSMAQRLIAVDFEEVDQELFDDAKEEVETKLEDLVDQKAEELKQQREETSSEGPSSPE